MNVCVRERGRTGVTVIDSHLLMQGHNYKLQLSPWKHVPMVTWGGFQGHNMIPFVCVCVFVRLFCCSYQLRCNKAYHTH